MGIAGDFLEERDIFLNLRERTVSLAWNLLCRGLEVRDRDHKVIRSEKKSLEWLEHGKSQMGGARGRPDHGAFQAVLSLDFIVGKLHNWFKEGQDWGRVGF